MKPEPATEPERAAVGFASSAAEPSHVVEENGEVGVTLDSATVARIQLERLIPAIRKDAVDRSRAVLTGQFSEQLAPYFPDFPYSPNEVRFLGKPVDFIVFRGCDSDAVSEVVFLEVKSGRSRLNATERSLKQAVLAGRVLRVTQRKSGKPIKRTIP